MNMSLADVVWIMGVIIAGTFYIKRCTIFTHSQYAYSKENPSEVIVYANTDQCGISEGIMMFSIVCCP